MIRNPVPWPNGARCAVAFTFDMDADSLLHLAHHSSADTRLGAMSALRYGPEIAIPRIVDIYERYGMQQTFFLPAWCMERYPAAVETVLNGGHEIGHHGYLHEEPNTMDRDAERAWMERSTEVIERMTGERPRGYRAPAYQFSRDTLDLLVEGEFAYDASLMGDDVPYLLRTSQGEIIELPSHIGLDDWPHFQTSRELDYRATIKPPEQAMAVYAAEFDAMWQHGGLWIGIWHPFLSGRLSRAQMICDLIEHMTAKGGVWFARLDEIAAHVQGVIEDGTWRPRIDRLPYYDGPIPELGEAAPENAE
ncbi:MAG: polysaccharide deacetylase [Paracoccaceae bacterium]|nr:polysaccharide deacetylase [Paracoccaceae bacterium]